MFIADTGVVRQAPEERHMFAFAWIQQSICLAKVAFMPLLWS